MAKTNSTRNLTDTFLKNTKRDGTRQEYRDAKTKGLTFRVNGGGSKVWVTRYRSGSSVKAHILGSYPDMPLAKARKEVVTFRDKIADGWRPDEKSKTKGKPVNGIELTTPPVTVKHLCDHYYHSFCVVKHKAPEMDLAVITRDIVPQIGTKRLNSITTATLSNVIHSVVDRGAPVWAGRTVALLKQLFSYAVAHGWLENSPAVALNRRFLGVEANVRERALDVDREGDALPEKLEIRAFWQAMETVPRLSPQVRHGLRILLLTGVRSGELRVAQWKDVDLDSGIWFIPAENTKTGVAWTVPLSDLAVQQFRQLRSLSREWVLPSIKGEGPLTDKALARSLARLFAPKGDNPAALDIPAFTPHDLRRTLRTHLSALDVDDKIAERCLNHVQKNIERVYNKSTELKKRREALQRWSDVIDLAVHDRQNVTPMVARHG